MTSRILSKSVAALRPAFGVASGSARRGVSSSPVMWRLKESSSHDGHETEKHKDDSLNKQKEGKAHWKPELASNSEEAIKADRTAEEDITKLQERTKHHAEEVTKSGTSTKDCL